MPLDILLVDDDELIQELYGRMLSADGHRVRSCDGPGALRSLRNENWDVLIVDVLMPEVDGLEIIRHCRERCGSRAPLILAMSGGGRISASDCLRMASAMGADDCIQKPFDMSMISPLLELA